MYLVFMKKSMFFLVLLFVNSSFSQLLDFDKIFIPDELGYKYFTDSYYEELNESGERVFTEEEKQQINNEVSRYEERIKVDSVSKINKIVSYRNIIEMHYILETEDKVFNVQSRLYELLNAEGNEQFKRLQCTNYASLIFSLINKYNSENNFQKSMSIIQKDINLLETHRYFRCGVGARAFYNRIGINLFDTYKGVGDSKRALVVAFKYLLNNKYYQEAVFDILVKEYGDEDVKIGYAKLFENFVEEKEG